MNQFQEMTTYIAVVEAANISAAARRLGTTKSVVSASSSWRRALGLCCSNAGKRLG